MPATGSGWSREGRRSTTRHRREHGLEARIGVVMDARVLLRRTAAAPSSAASDAPARNAGIPRRRSAHVHWFHWIDDDAFSGSSLYACRCGQVRPGL